MIESIEAALLQYGVLGCWVIFLLYEKISLHKRMRTAIENNTTVTRQLGIYIKALKK